MHVCMDMRLGPSTSVRIIAKSVFQGVRNKGLHCRVIYLSCICNIKFIICVYNTADCNCVQTSYIAWTFTELLKINITARGSYSRTIVL